MAIDIPLLTRRRVFATKIETTTGSAISLSSSDGAFNAFNPDIKPNIALSRREGQGASIDPLTGIPSARGASVSLITELYGAATSPAWNTLALAAGGLLTSRTITFPGANINDTTLTQGFYEDGWLFQASGTKLNMRMYGQSGQQNFAEWTGTGLWQPPTAVALIAPTYPTTVAPRNLAAFTIGGSSEKISNWELNLNNVIVYREDETETATGYHSVAITDRNIQFKCDPERQALATRDWYAAYLAGTEFALVLTIGASANNIISITAPKMQLAEPPEPGERNGIQIDNLVFQLNRSAAAGDDALTWVYS